MRLADTVSLLAGGEGSARPLGSTNDSHSDGANRHKVHVEVSSAGGKRKTKKITVVGNSRHEAVENATTYYASKGYTVHGCSYMGAARRMTTGEMADAQQKDSAKAARGQSHRSMQVVKKAKGLAKKHRV